MFRRQRLTESPSKFAKFKTNTQQSPIQNSLENSKDAPERRSENKLVLPALPVLREDISLLNSNIETEIKMKMPFRRMESIEHGSQNSFGKIDSKKKMMSDVDGKDALMQKKFDFGSPISFKQAAKLRDMRKNARLVSDNADERISPAILKISQEYLPKEHAINHLNNKVNYHMEEDFHIRHKSKRKDERPSIINRRLINTSNRELSQEISEFSSGPDGLLVKGMRGLKKSHSYIRKKDNFDSYQNFTVNNSVKNENYGYNPGRIDTFITDNEISKIISSATKLSPLNSASLLKSKKLYDSLHLKKVKPKLSIKTNHKIMIANINSFTPTTLNLN